MLSRPGGTVKNFYFTCLFQFSTSLHPLSQTSVPSASHSATIPKGRSNRGYRTSAITRPPVPCNRLEGTLAREAPDPYRMVSQIKYPSATRKISITPPSTTAIFLLFPLEIALLYTSPVPHATNPLIKNVIGT